MGNDRAGSASLLLAGAAGLVGAVWVRSTGDTTTAGLFALGGVACVVGALTGGITSVVARVIGFVVTAVIILRVLT